MRRRPWTNNVFCHIIWRTASARVQNIQEDKGKDQWFSQNHPISITLYLVIWWPSSLSTQPHLDSLINSLHCGDLICPQSQFWITSAKLTTGLLAETFLCDPLRMAACLARSSYWLTTTERGRRDREKKWEEKGGQRDCECVWESGEPVETVRMTLAKRERLRVRENKDFKRHVPQGLICSY